jgi:hypothetical protein
MASRRSKSTKSVGNLINDARNKVQQIQTSSVSGSSGVAEGGISAAAMGVNAVTTDIIAPGSITADKLAAGINSPGGQALQRVPSPVVDVKYWTEVVAERVAVHTEAYFLNKEAKNISATASGLLFSPEKSANLTVTYRELEPTGATITTNVASGYDAGDTITVSGVGSPFDGTWTVLSIDEDSNAISYLVQEGTQERIAVTSDKYLTATITGLSKASNVVTFVANNSFREDQLVSITGVSPTAYNFTDAHVQTANATHFAVYDEISTGSYVSGGTAVAIPTAKSDDNAFAIGYYETDDSTGIVSITTVVDHGFELGDLVEVGGLGSPYDGTFVITEANVDIPKEFKYDTTVGVVEPEAVTGGYVSVEADAGIFLTGKYPIPVSKKISVNWISSESIDIYGVYWNLVNDAAVPTMIKIQTGSTGVIEKVGANAYEWDIPSDASHYAIYAEVLADSAERYLQEISVFEVVGDKNQKSSRIATVDIKDHVITVTTAEPHSFVVGDEIIFDKMDYVSNRLNGVKLPIASITNASTFVVNSTSSTDDTVNALNLSDTYDVVDMTNTLALVYGGTQKATTTISPTEVIVTDRLGATLSSITDTANNEITIRDSSGQAIAGIKKDGSAVFTSLDADQHLLNGVDTIGTFETAQFNGYAYNELNTANIAAGELETENSYLNRLARGVIYEAYFSMSAFTLNIDAVNSPNYTLASGNFSLEPNRAYKIVPVLSGLYVNNNSNKNVSVMLRVGSGPLSIGGDSFVASRTYVAANSGSNTLFLEPIILDSSSIPNSSYAIIGKRIISNVVTLRVDGAGLVSGDKIGVVDTGYPYSGYWALTADATDYGDGTVGLKYNLQGAALTANQGETVSRSVTANLVSGQTLVRVANTTGLFPGFTLTKTSGVGVFGTNAVVNTIVNATAFTTNVNHITSGTMTFSATQFTNVTSPTSLVWESTNFTGGVAFPRTPIYWELLATTSPAANVAVNFAVASDTGTGFLEVIDHGQAKALSFALTDDAGRTVYGSQASEYDNGSGGAGSGSTVTATTIIETDQSAYYDNYGRGTGTTDPYAYRYSLYQGNPGTASGTKKSAVSFFSAGISSLANLSVTKVQLYLRNRHSYSSNGLTTYIGMHIDDTLTNQSTVPPGVSSTSVDSFSVHFDRGQGKWVTLPTEWNDFIGSGDFKGILIGLQTAPGTWYGGLTNYGYFDGDTMADPPRLKITYQYDE